ncbi:guanine deaminase-like isoform X2 [Ceratina calcarata]|uniref:Guanine deaminase n=1 Tax=Ceratina calcarata TaxID=156304 RepID=A0AAJ7S1I1_9HYME|nr:guanine deaminase-like isoform X2 [Ceratina calcarata]XP_026668909.1 guanine deaminase-like isoform X2 [Ceratina calcarata]XP_026668910.1 guanine deaminase-like isoform X2 [Ceratina calcarata]XP_026668911.1 guanine deaminase-like isoform X2 [Ceratina calcarata]XP_026668912.1 guanine deaminase-like isoform X2 [Ceratina calcarata]XP_026668913.1 guanine deaminase-like isoform X2 [Ceratina calcarata]
MSLTISNEKVFVGSIIHTNESGELIIIDHGAIYIDTDSGKICNIIVNPKSDDIKNKNVTVLSGSQFLIPGFIDCHIHAVQLPNLGIGYDKKLLEWLETYTFPLERKYVDESFAKRVFNTVVRQTIKQGTTTACYFASLYSKASLILGQEALSIGQRAFIGKLSMNEKRSDNYYESTEDSIKNISKFIQDLDNLNSPLIKSIITPRFALSCDMTLMKELGTLAKEKNLRIQTHVSENLDEIQAVKNKFPKHSSYTAVYDAAGLLTNKTVLAHGIYLSDDEIALLKIRNTAVIHCPLSNTCLKSGLCDVQRFKRGGLKIGLGSDVSGGPSYSILDSIRSTLQLSNHLSFIKDNYESLSYKDVFHMATLGGAAALAIDDQVGNFKVDKEFDALVVDTDIAEGLLNNLQQCTLEERFQKFIYSGDDRNIIEVYVRGRKVK